MKALQKKEIIINKDINPIKLEYSDSNKYSGDTVVTIYDDYKISLVLTDDCGAVIDNKIFFPKQGDIMIFRPNEVHFGRFPKLNEYKFLSFLIPTDFFDNIFTESKNIISPFLDVSKDKINLFHFPEKEKAKLIDIAEGLMELIKDSSESHSYDIIIFAKLIEVLDICNKFYTTQKNVQYISTTPIIVTQTINKIDECFPDFIGLNNLAKYCGCSVTYLTQTFKRYTGKSIHEYLTQRRLEYARRLLQRGSSVTEACYQSGFSDCSRFILQFKKHFNITPGKYKKT